MKKLWLILLLCLPICAAQPGPYVAKGWVFYDKQDKEGLWHLGALDKRQHAAVGFVIGAGVAAVLQAAEVKHPRLWAFLAALLVGYAKEVYDLRKGSGTAEVADAFWTAAGGAGGATLVTIRW